jgi:HTH-type transcriptional regulator / antitoxin HigA
LIRFIGTHIEYNKINADTILNFTKMDIKPLKTKTEDKNALARLEKIFDAPVNWNEDDEAEILSLLIERYENQHYSVESPDQVETITVRMEEMNLKQIDLIGIIWGKCSVSEILNKKRKLTLEMIRNLNKNLNISASIIVSNYNLSKWLISY